jgi:hypothetical protein
MKTRTASLKTFTATAALAAALVLSPSAAFADSDGDKSNTGGTSEQAAPAADKAIDSAEAKQEAIQQVAPDTLPALKAKAAERISKRLTDLGQWSAKLASAPADCGQNAAAVARIAATQASLTTLSTAIAGATTIEAAKPLYQQIFTHNRVYAVVSPVVHLALACDHQWARAAKQTAAVAELQTKLAAATAAGANTTAASALLVQVAPAIAAGKQSAATASASIVGLAPDQGNEATKASNAAAIVAARAQIKQADAQLDAAATLLTQTRQSLGIEVKADKKADKESEKAKKKSEKETEKAAKQAEKAKKKSEKETERAAKKANKKDNKKDNEEKD